MPGTTRPPPSTFWRTEFTVAWHAFRWRPNSARAAFPTSLLGCRRISRRPARTFVPQLTQDTDFSLHQRSDTGSLERSMLNELGRLETRDCLSDPMFGSSPAATIAHTSSPPSRLPQHVPSHHFLLVLSLTAALPKLSWSHTAAHVCPSAVRSPARLHAHHASPVTPCSAMRRGGEVLRPRAQCPLCHHQILTAINGAVPKTSGTRNSARGKRTVAG